MAGLLVLDREPAGESASRADCARYTEQLSLSATIALTGIFITGAIGAWRGLGALANVAGNPYGTTLLVKIGLVMTAAALGGVNRFVVMPHLLEGLRTPHTANLEASRRLTAVLKVEALVLLAVLVAAASLSSTPPPFIS